MAYQTLGGVYAIVYLDALVVKVRDGAAVRNHPCYLAIGVNLDGGRDVLGIAIYVGSRARSLSRSGPRNLDAHGRGKDRDARQKQLFVVGERVWCIEFYRCPD